MPGNPMSLRKCPRLIVALVLLCPQIVFGQLPTLDPTPETPAETPGFPDPLRLTDGWQQDLRDGEELSQEKLVAWSESLAILRDTATPEERVELDRLIGNINSLLQPDDAAGVAEPPSPDVNTLEALLALVELHRALARDRDATDTQVRLDKQLAADVEIRLNQARQTYVSTASDDPQRAALGWRWIRLWSRQTLVDRELEILRLKQQQLATAIDSIRSQLASPPEQLIFDESTRTYWNLRVDSLAASASTDFSDTSGSDLSLEELTVAARARADHLAYRVAERAKQFTEVQLGLRQSRPAPERVLNAIDTWMRDIQTVVSNRRERLLANIEASSLDASGSAVAVQRELETIRALSEQLNRIAIGQEQYQLIERQFSIADGFSISNFGATWGLFTERFTLFSENVLNRTLFKINESPVTGNGILKMLIIIAIAYLISWMLRRVLERLERRKNLSAAAAFTFNRVLHYALIVLGFLIAISSIGVDLTKFALFASAIGVGLGFGLQAIISNFVSGLIILFERSLKIGDFVELESGVTGRVNEINVRGTIITTNDNIDILVPNAEFVNGKVTNWTLRDVVRRLRIRFGVAYGSDKELVKKAGLEAAASLPFTMDDDPKRITQVWLVGFGDSSLDFELVVWVSGDAVSRPNAVDAAYKWAIETALKKYQIEIPFPQQDLHVRSYFGLTGNAAINAVSGEAIPEPVRMAAPPQLSTSERRELEVNDAVADTLRDIDEFKLEKERDTVHADEKSSDNVESAKRSD